MKTKEQRETEVILRMGERLDQLDAAVESIMGLRTKYDGEHAFIEIMEILENVQKRS